MTPHHIFRRSDWCSRRAWWWLHGWGGNTVCVDMTFENDLQFEVLSMWYSLDWYLCECECVCVCVCVCWRVVYSLRMILCVSSWGWILGAAPLSDIKFYFWNLLGLVCQYPPLPLCKPIKRTLLVGVSSLILSLKSQSDHEPPRYILCCVSELFQPVQVSATCLCCLVECGLTLCFWGLRQAKP